MRVQLFFFQKTINLTDEFGIFLRVVGGLNIVNRSAAWEFQSIDPATGNVWYFFQKELRTQ